MWEVDIFEEELACDIQEEFDNYLMEGMDEKEALEEILLNNQNLMEDEQQIGTFILTIAVIGKENEVKIKGIKKLLRKLEKNEEYWSSVKEESEELYEARQELLDELLS